MLTPQLTEQIKSLIESSEIMLFMKGDELLPKCGFSAQVVDILKELSLEFHTFDILEDEQVRAGLKEYANWPTFPQLYFKGELIGGSDIVTEMYENGELKELLCP